MVLELLDAGEDVVVLDNLSTGFRWAVPAGSRRLSKAMSATTTRGPAAVEHGIDAIIHFAGSIVVPESVADPLGYYLNNTCKSRSLIASAVESGIQHFIFSSTAAVYGMPKEIRSPRRRRPADSPYGTSKLMTEDAARHRQAHDLRYVALRYFNVAGADPQGRTGQSTPRPRISSRWRAQRRSGSGPIWKYSGPIIRRRTAPASATISM